MIQKGTQEYRQAQVVANSIAMMASYDKSSISANDFSMAKTEIELFCESIKKLDCFAAQVAETVLKSIAKSYSIVASISSKQAWILACAAIENGIEIDNI